ncbi:WXG100 family type VII secretion target [Arthrobacter sp. Cr_A7]|uniref:WXG100 family type VII secretion target n=1 Tax=Arthrobacter sp. Cr_A7 TaxID=3031017 RepID=UPI0023DB0F9C|nr:WXG100 family type VII secretion target [Arthrobacter sp. Cr_A7]MDF2052380.1 WXG100 family type VII secretion target [Arthrobacter sp. Cr_A7]
MWGADVEQLRNLARELGRTSDSLLQQSTSLGSAINNNSSWKGQDAVRFRSDWNGTHRMLLQQTALALKQESAKLLEHANQQENASNSGGSPAGISGGGGTGAGNSGPAGPWGPEWLSNGDSPFRRGWDAYNGVLGMKTSPLAVRDITQFAGRYGDDIATAWQNGFRADALAIIRSEELWNVAKVNDELRGFFSTTADLVSGRFGDLAESIRMPGAAELTDSSMFRLNAAGNLLGAVGIGLDGLDTVNAIRAGETGDAMRSGFKTALGLAAFAPPPINVTSMVISGAWAAVELFPGAKDAIDSSFDVAGEVVEDVVNNVSEGVKDFFGW